MSKITWRNTTDDDWKNCPQTAILKIWTETTYDRFGDVVDEESWNDYGWSKFDVTTYATVLLQRAVNHLGISYCDVEEQLLRENKPFSIAVETYFSDGRPKETLGTLKFLLRLPTKVE